MTYYFFFGEGMYHLSQLFAKWWMDRRSGRKEASRLEVLFNLPFPPLLLKSGRILDTADAARIALVVNRPFPKR